MKKHLLFSHILALTIPARSYLEAEIGESSLEDEVLPELAVEVKQPRISVVRDNLMNQKYYTPYCGRDGKCFGLWPRTVFTGSQFECESCGWVSSFEEKFIQEYKAKKLKGDYSR